MKLRHGALMRIAYVHGSHTCKFQLIRVTGLGGVGTASSDPEPIVHRVPRYCFAMMSVPARHLWHSMWGPFPASEILAIVHASSPSSTCLGIKGSSRWNHIDIAEMGLTRLCVGTVYLEPGQTQVAH